MRRHIAAAGACMVFLLAWDADAAGDPVRGARLHDDCLGCHGTELYVPPRAKVKTLSALKKEVDKWNDRMNPKFTTQEIEDLVTWLNATFYKFPQ